MRGLSAAVAEVVSNEVGDLETRKRIVRGIAAKVTRLAGAPVEVEAEAEAEEAPVPGTTGFATPSGRPPGIAQIESSSTGVEE